MPSAADRLDFGPPRDAGSLRAFVFALLAHLLLIAALTWGVNWKHSDPEASFEAEIWSSIPPQTASRSIEEAAPLPVPPTPPEPVVKAPEIKPQPITPDVDIALEQEKKRKLLEQQKQADAQKLLDKQKAKEVQAKRLAEAEEAKKLEANKLAKQQATDKLAQASTEKQRKENLARMMGGLPGDANAKGNQASAGGKGASRTYGSIVRAAVKPNIVFTEEFVGNPMARVEVRLTSEGTILSQRLVESSGNKAWDDAAIKAIIRTQVMPRDVDGRIPDTILILEMRPRG